MTRTLWTALILLVSGLAPVAAAADVDLAGEPRGVVREVVGGEGGDVLRGTPEPETLRGAGGPDLVIGYGGDDWLYGGPDPDRLRGGEGADRLFGGSGRDRLDGGPGDDALAGEDDRDVGQGGAGSDVLLGGAGDDRLSGGADDDRILGGLGDDVLRGDAGNDRLNGGLGRDRLIGGPGADILVGGPGRNQYAAGPGDDRINARNGVRETVNCGAGRDRVEADRSDRLRGCEVRLRPGAQGRAAVEGIRVRGNTNWFASGLSIPQAGETCDFGCAGQGLAGRERWLDDTLYRMRRNGFKVVRWHVFSHDAPALRNEAGGLVERLPDQALADLDALLRIARRHDIYVQPVLFSHPEQLPAEWITDPVLSTQLRAVIAPFVRRRARDQHLFALEVVSAPENLISTGVATQDQVRTWVSGLVAQSRAQGVARTTLSPTSIDDIDRWRDLGLSFYAPFWWSEWSSGPRCATCISAAELRVREGVSEPIMISAFDLGSANVGFARLRQLRALGYAGALGWSVEPAPINHLSPGDGPTPSKNSQERRSHHAGVEHNYRVAWGAGPKLMHAFSDIGPRRSVRNPCWAPGTSRLRCPDLVMKPPFGLSVERVKGRVRLRAGNSIDSIGKGPAELRGSRSGPRTMRAVQMVHTRQGGRRVVRTGAQLTFKLVPGQDRFWKFQDAARFELWRLDEAGNRERLVRTGPKVAYCLRDLQRTRSGLAGSPKDRVYPACSQDRSDRAVTLGTSIGWSDIYPPKFHEQWIDVTRLRGCFAYVHIADPENGIKEINEQNNISTVTVQLPWQGKKSLGCAGGPATLGPGPAGGYPG